MYVYDVCVYTNTFQAPSSYFGRVSGRLVCLRAVSLFTCAPRLLFFPVRDVRAGWMGVPSLTPGSGERAIACRVSIASLSHLFLPPNCRSKPLHRRPVCPLSVPPRTAPTL